MVTALLRAESPRLRVAVVGLGRWGANYVTTLGRLPRYELVAGVDPDARKHRGQPVPVYDKLADLFCSVEVSAIVIASPDHTHYALAREALLADKHVLVEKPMALDSRQAEALARLAQARNRVLGVGHTMVYHDRFWAIKKEVSNGKLGEPVRITAVRTSHGSTSSTGVLYDLVTHDLAMAIAVFGLPLAARSRVGAGRRSLSYQLVYPGDVVMSGWAAWTDGPRVRRFRITGTCGTAVFTDAAPGDREDWFTRPLTRQCVDFLLACRTGRVPRAGAVQGVLVCRCLAALARSGDGTWVMIDGGNRLAGQTRQAADRVRV